jgi:signal transduction histidine kinase
MLRDHPGYDTNRGMAKRDEDDALDGDLRRRAFFRNAPVGLGDWDLSAVFRRMDEIDPGELGLRERLHRDASTLRRLVGAIRVHEVNDVMLELFGAATSGELMACLPDLVTSDSLVLFAELFAALAAGERHIERAGKLSRLDGRRVRVAIGIVLPEPDDHSFAVVSMMDVGRLRDDAVAELEVERHAEELDRVSFEIDRLFWAVSHDLRAPLRGVANLATWIEEDLAEDRRQEVKQHLTTLQGRVARMDDMLSALLDYAKVGRVDEELENVDVGDILSDIAADDELVPEGFTLTWLEMPIVVTQASLLRGVLVGLVDNAVKHHDRNQGRITVSAEDRELRWAFRVADDGPGIPERYRERVFHLFSTLRRRDEVEGSGMGLAFVQKVVVGQGGTIEIEDESPRGTAFVFTWPKVSRSEPSEEPPPSVRPGRLP